MLTATRAHEVAARHQRRAVIQAAEYATTLGEPVGFVRRPVPGGAVFEAVALDTARTCAVVDVRGELRRIASDTRPSESHRHRVPATQFSRSVSRAAERALVACARPRNEPPA